MWPCGWDVYPSILLRVEFLLGLKSWHCPGGPLARGRVCLFHKSLSLSTATYTFKFLPVCHIVTRHSDFINNDQYKGSSKSFHPFSPPHIFIYFSDITYLWTLPFCFSLHFARQSTSFFKGIKITYFWLCAKTVMNCLMYLVITYESSSTSQRLL